MICTIVLCHVCIIASGQSDLGFMISAIGKGGQKDETMPANFDGKDYHLIPHILN